MVFVTKARLLCLITLLRPAHEEMARRRLQKQLLELSLLHYSLEFSVV